MCRAGKFSGADGERRHVRQRPQLQRAGGRGGSRSGSGGGVHHEPFGPRGLRALQQRHQEVRGGRPGPRRAGPGGGEGNRPSWSGRVPLGIIGWVSGDRFRGR